MALPAANRAYHTRTQTHTCVRLSEFATAGRCRTAVNSCSIDCHRHLKCPHLGCKRFIHSAHATVCVCAGGVVGVWARPGRSKALLYPPWNDRPDATTPVTAMPPVSSVITAIRHVSPANVRMQQRIHVPRASSQPGCQRVKQPHPRQRPALLSPPDARADQPTTQQATTPPIEPPRGVVAIHMDAVPQPIPLQLHC